MSDDIRESCLCGAVRFELTNKPLALTFCHCSRCRKAQGGPFGAHFIVRGGDFRYVSGAEHVKTFAPQQLWKFARSFCDVCGSALGELGDTGARDFPIAAATLDDDPGVRLKLHEHVASKAPWFEITDTAPQYAEGPPREAFK